MRPPQDTETKLRKAIDVGDADTILTLGARLDAEDAHKTRPALLPSALWYASVGLKVFPLRPREKIPFPSTHGCKDATTDEAQIRAWWAATPDANLGIATGHIIDVIDIDGPVGVRSWAAMIASGALPPVLGKVSTPRAGGNHLYVAAQGRGNKAGLLPGVDHRGAGGYVVAPPSINGDGIAYTWYQPLNLAAIEAAA